MSLGLSCESSVWDGENSVNNLNWFPALKESSTSSSKDESNDILFILPFY